jgi:FixJ family two-component response regulator
MGLAEITIKIHRGHVMQKMAARSLADLVKMGQALGVGEPHS